MAQDEEGQTGYAMRFIQGETLREAIQRLHQTGQDTPEHRLGLRQLLNRFIAVCNTVAYAHSRGIIHRDLKPANIMLGPYGETVIVDWGLAKQLHKGTGRPGDKEIDEDSVSVSDPPERTQAGQVLGTPAYMSPEQAAGRWEDVGPASDLYSLGATLYTLLTGQAPFGNEAEPALLEKIQQGVFPRPRQRQAGVPAALEAVCLKAMARRPEERYVTPLELAADVERWLADEPVSAYPEGYLARGCRWMRRHRPLLAGVSAAVLVAGVLGGGGWLWRLHARAVTARAADQALSRALERYDHGDLAEALTDARRADALLEGGGGNEDLRGRVRTVLADLRMVQRLEEIRRHQVPGQEGYLDPAAADAAYAAAFQEYGIDVEHLAPAAVVEAVHGRAIRGQLITALDLWARSRRSLRAGEPAAWRRLQEVARAADSDPWRQRQAEGYYHLGRALTERRQLDEAITAYQQAVRLRPNYAAAHCDLGMVLAWKNRLDAALEACQTAVRLEPNLARAHFNLGFVLLRKNQLDAAIAAFHKATDLDPDFFDAYTFLGRALLKKGRPKEALAACQAALRLKPNNVAAYDYLGNALLMLDQVDPAVAAFREAIRLNPNYPEAHRDLGRALLRQHRPDQAIAACRQAIALKLGGQEVHYYLGNGLAQLGRWEEAARAYQRAIAIKKDYAEAYCQLGQVLQKRGQFSQALAALQRGHAFGTRNPHWSLPSERWVRQCQRWAEVEEKLPGVLAGAVQPVNAREWAEFAWLCLLQGRYAPAAHCLRMAGAVQVGALWASLRLE